MIEIVILLTHEKQHLKAVLDQIVRSATQHLTGCLICVKDVAVLAQHYQAVTHTVENAFDYWRLRDSQAHQR